MALTADPRRTRGALVHALAMHVTSEAECARRYGNRKKTKLLRGRVHEVDIDRSGKRSNCFLVIDFDLGGETTERKHLNVRSVKIGSPPEERAAFATESGTLTRHTEKEVELEGPSAPLAYSILNGASRSTAEPTDGPIDVHGTLWVSVAAGEDITAVGGPVSQRSCAVRTVTGETICGDADYSERSPIDYFLMLFPPKQLRAMVHLTNRELAAACLTPTRPGEILKFIGVLMLCTRYEFGERRSLWSKNPPSKYLPAPHFGKTGMSSSRFDSLFRYVRFSEQPEQTGDMTSEKYRWAAVDDFVTRFNEHRISHVIPSDTICVDESIARWYEQGGDWINHGLPMYIAIDRKPENGCEIQNSACGRIGIMLRLLKLVKTAREEETTVTEEDDELLHGTVVLKELVFPWCQSNRIVCADSYFASVGAAQELSRLGLRFIGVIKTASRRYPMNALGAIEMQQRGESVALVSKDDKGIVCMMAIAWMDRDRRYFITTASSRAAGTPYSRKRWRQVDSNPNTAPERVELTVPQPEAAEIYYSACAQIDRHNRCRQADLSLERKIGTLCWSKQVNMSILGICIVDAWQAYKHCRGRRCFLSQRDFYNTLTTELIDNNFDVIGHRDRQDCVTESAAVVDGLPRSGIDAHLTPTKRRRMSNGQETRNLQQGKCVVCRCKSTKECSLCRDMHKTAWICDTKNGKTCFAAHLQTQHNI